MCLETNKTENVVVTLYQKYYLPLCYVIQSINSKIRMKGLEIKMLEELYMKMTYLICSSER